MILVASQGMMGEPNAVLETPRPAQTSDLDWRSPMPEHTVDGAQRAVNPPFARNCPECGDVILHTLHCNRNKAVRNRTPCRRCMYAARSIAYAGSGNPFFGKKHTEKTLAVFRARQHPHVHEEWFKQLRAEQMRGTNNPNKGTSVYATWVRKFGKERADELMDGFRSKSSRANSGHGNPMYGKPTPQGSGNGWSGWYRGWFFRSLRELSYMVRVIEANGLRWRTGESSDLKIPYVGHDGSPRTYTADFLVNETVLVEIKPKRLHDSPTVAAKKAAAEAFCRAAGLKYRLVDPEPLPDAEVSALRSMGLLRFTERYESKYAERMGQCRD